MECETEALMPELYWFMSLFSLPI